MKHRFTFLLFCLILSIPSFGQSVGSLSVSVKTSDAGGKYKPRHVLAIWVEDGNGKFVKTLLAYANKRIKHLNTWEGITSAAGSMYNKVDAISGATQSSHTTRTCFWDGTNYKGSLMPDGAYTVHMELTDKNSTGRTTKIDFVKGQETTEIKPANVASFSNITIKWLASASTPVDKIKEDKEVILYPNPSSGVFYLNSKEPLNIKIMNLAGVTILEERTHKIDLSKSPRGMYIYHIKKGDHQFVGRCIKE